MTPNKGMFCSGNVNVAILGPGDVLMGYAGVRNTVELSITHDPGESKKRISKMISGYGSTLDAIRVPGGVTIDIKFDDIDQETLAMAILGSVSTLTVAAGTLSSPLRLTQVKLGTWYKLPHRFVSAFTIETTSTPSVALIEANYQVDVNAGLIRILSGVSDNSDLDLSYSYGEVDATVISPSTNQQINVAIYGTLRNLVTGKDVVINIPKAALVPSEPIDWLGGEYAVAALTGDIVSIGSNPPYTVTADN